MIIYSEGATSSQEDEANIILSVLCDVYPGHPWAVRVYEGGVHIRHLRPDGRMSGYGMNVKFKDVSHDWAVMKREIILMAGEWLERSGIARARFDGDQEFGRVEGVPEKYQPGQKLPDDVNIVFSKPDVPRETLRPLVMKNGKET